MTLTTGQNSWKYTNTRNRMAKMNRRRILSLRCDMRSASIALIFCTLLALGETAGAQQGYKFDVETYGGAVCDGVTDDTSAVQKTINAAAAMLQAGGSPGPIYFPPSLHSCKVDTLTWPSVNHGWLYSLFDNGLYANRIKVGTRNAYIGRTSNFQGLSGPFLFGPSASWVQWQKPTNLDAFVDVNGVLEVYFEGLNIQQQHRTQPTVHVHDNNGIGSVNIGFIRCAVGGSAQPFVIDSSKRNIPAGFNLRILDSSISSTGNGPALSISNYGYVTVRGGYLTSAAIIGSPEIQLMDGYRFEDLLSENLKNYPWLTVDHGGSNIILDSIRIADPVGTAYLVLNKKTGTSLTIRNCGINDGQSLVDPASVPNGLQGVIESIGARATYKQAAAAFQWGQFTSVNGPTIWYGNPTFLNSIGPPMQVRP
jgi:hypothetical protein